MMIITLVISLYCLFHRHAYLRNDNGGHTSKSNPKMLSLCNGEFDSVCTVEVLITVTFSVGTYKNELFFLFLNTIV